MDNLNSLCDHRQSENPDQRRERYAGPKQSKGSKKDAEDTCQVDISPGPF